MNRIDRIFQQMRPSGGKALMPYITAGDPDLPTTAALLPAMQEAGASVVEIGIPFSDPVADGPVIQASMAHALEQGFDVHALFEQVQQVRDQLSLGLVAMVSYSIVHRMGVQDFVARAAEAGFDGFIFPDLPLEEAHRVAGPVSDAGLMMSMLIAPTTPIERAQAIARASTGFIYLLSRAGITGERAALPAELPERVRKLRQVTDLPIAVGFGIASGEQVGQVARVADAAIVGSALMRRVAEHRQQRRDMLVNDVSAFVRELATGLAEPSRVQS